MDLEIRSVIAERADDIKRASQGRGGRLEFFKSLALLNLVNREVPDEDYISDVPEQERYYAMWKKIVADEKTAADFAANSRTTTGVAVRNLDSEESRSVLFWRFLIERLLDTGGETSGNKRTLGDAFADWKTTSYLDRHYSYELVARLPQIVDRASVLERVQHKEVANETVRRLFTEAHEVFLYGFDNACIALCRSLIEHALREKLRVPRKEKRRLEFMIQEAEEKGLLDNIESTSAEAVEAAGKLVSSAIFRCFAAPPRLYSITHATFSINFIVTPFAARLNLSDRSASVGKQRRGKENPGARRRYRVQQASEHAEPIAVLG